MIEHMKEELMTESTVTVETIVPTDPSVDSDVESEEDHRNVTDEYKRMPMEMIKASLDERRLPVVNVCMNLTSDFNKSSVVRASNAFLASKVVLVGRRKWDRRGAVGTQHTETIEYQKHAEEVISGLKDDGYTVFAVDNTKEFHPVAVYDVDLPLKSAFVYGEEKLGLSADIVALCDQSVYIPQHGSVRSLNVSQAAAVMLSEYSRTWRH